MARTKPNLFPNHQRLLEQLGERLRLARKRRKLTTGQVAERAGISRSTLYHLEMGEANTSIGTLLQVLVSLRLEDDVTLLGKDDVLGQRLIDAQLLGSSRKRPANDPRKKTVSKDDEP